MVKNLIQVWSVAALFLVLSATGALAAPTTYAFTSGSVTLRVTDNSTGQSVLTDSSGTIIPSTVVPLIGSHATFDPATGTNGTLLDIQIDALNPFVLYLDSSVQPFQSVSVANASLINMPGTTADRTPSNSFQIDTIMTSLVTGTFPDTTTIGPIPYTSNTAASQMTGTLGVSGDSLNLGIFGINLATFDSFANPGGNDITVKADFTFISTVVPEPGTALLLGLGLVGLGSAGRRSR